MKLVLTFLILFIALVKRINGMFASAQIFLTGTNDSIGTIVFYQDPDVWGVVVSGFVDRLRPMATLVSFLSNLSPSIF
jgi:hypothetical protein